MTNKKIEGKSKCADCMANKSLFHRKKSKVGYYCFWILKKLNLIKHADILLKVQKKKKKKKTESADSKVLKTKNGRPMLL